MEEPGAQVYVVSSGIECADQLFQMAAGFVETNKFLNSRLWVRHNIRTIEDKKNRSKLRVLSGDKKGKSGQGASCVFWDELAEIQDDEAWHRLYNSGMARKQPIWLSISTPQYARHSLAWAQYTKAKNVISGSGDGHLDPYYLAVIKGVPEDVEWRNEDGTLKDCFFDHIPALGVTCTREYIENDWASVQGNPREICRFTNHVAGQWTAALTEWLSPDKVAGCMKGWKDFDAESLEKQKADCIMTLDGADNGEAALCLLFPDSMKVMFKLYYPQKQAIKSDEKRQTTLIQWGKEGYINITTGQSGEGFDWPIIKADMIEALEKYNVREIAFDPVLILGLVSELQDVSYAPCIPIRGTRTNVSAATSYLERLIQQNEITIQENPVVEWNLLNAVIDENAIGQLLIDRNASGGRYDAASALILALSRLLIEKETCVYNEPGRGILSF